MYVPSRSSRSREITNPGKGQTRPSHPIELYPRLLPCDLLAISHQHRQHSRLQRNRLPRSRRPLLQLRVINLLHPAQTLARRASAAPPVEFRCLGSTRQHRGDHVPLSFLLLQLLAALHAN